MNKITEDYVSYDTAVLLKEKGFNEEVRTFYTSNGKLEYCAFPLNHNLDIGSGFTSAPSQSLAIKWLREVHDLHIVVYPWQADKEEKAIHWCCKVYKSFAHLGNDVYTNETPKSYEEAIEAALKYTLENLI